MGNYRDLQAWKASQALAVITYRVTSKFPSAERFGLTAQMRRAAVSIASNIAEGAGRGSDAQLANFLHIARGSLRELECQSLLSVELGLTTADAMSDLLEANEKVGKLLHGLIRAVGG